MSTIKPAPLKTLKDFSHISNIDNIDTIILVLKKEAIKWIKERQIPYGDFAEFFNLTAGLMTEDYWDYDDDECEGVEYCQPYCHKVQKGRDKAAHEKAMQAIKDKIHIIEQCQEFTSCTFPCKNKSCKNRKYCILAGGSIKRLFAASNTKPKEDEKVKYINGRKFYKNRTDAEHERRKGDRIYIEPTHGWYIIRPQKRGLWN